MAEWDKPSDPSEGSENGDDAGPDRVETYDDHDDKNIWMRGLFMLILAFLFGIAEMILVAFAVLQFLWMLFGKEKNAFLAESGHTIGAWLHAVAQFQTGATDEKPFPWRGLD